MGICSLGLRVGVACGWASRLALVGLWGARRARVVGLLLLPTWAEGRRPGWASWLVGLCAWLGPEKRKGTGLTG